MITEKLLNGVKDTLTIAKRNLIRTTRSPQMLVFATVQPVMLLLLFNYVFGGAIKLGPGIDSYIVYLLPGLIVQTMLFGSTQAVVGVNADANSGIIDRFKSLPMARSAVVFGRVVSDTVRNIFVILLMTTIGYALGFELMNGLLNGFLAFGLLLLFSFTMSWVSVSIGLLAKDPETAQTAGFIWIFPIAFASSIFVPVQTMPDWLQTFASNQPISLVANSVRGLAVTGDTADVGRALLWLLGLFITFFFISTKLYSRRNR